MRRTAIAILTLVLPPAQGLFAQALERVDFLRGSIVEQDDRYIRLRGGSTWALASASTVKVADDVLIVFRDVEVQGKRLSVGTAYHDGAEIGIEEVSGAYATTVGYLTAVVEARGTSVLTLEDGTRLSVPALNPPDSSWWRPPYRALLTSDRTYLFNLRTGKSVRVSPVR